MAETMEEYMCKTQGHYGSGVIRPKIDAKYHFELKANFSKNYVTAPSVHNGTSRIKSNETSDGLAAIQAQLNNLGREIKKVNEKVYVVQVRCKLIGGVIVRDSFCKASYMEGRRFDGIITIRNGDDSVT
nr:hypothetical protein [Tanacetum cinerariifolium]